MGVPPSPLPRAFFFLSHPPYDKKRLLQRRETMIRVVKTTERAPNPYVFHWKVLSSNSMQKMCMYFVMCMYFAAFTTICVVISALSVSSAMGKFRKEGLTKHSLRPILDWRKCIVLGKFRQYIFPFTDRTRTCYEIRQKQENIVRDLPENPRLLAFGHACFAHLAKALKSQ